MTFEKAPLCAGTAHRESAFAFAGRKKVPFSAGSHRLVYPTEDTLGVVSGIGLKKDVFAGRWEVSRGDYGHLGGGEVYCG